MTQEQKDTLNKYAELKKEIKRLETISDEINPEVIEIMRKNEVEEITINDLGKLSLGSRRTWVYPKEIKEKEEELKKDKKQSEQLGTADYVEKHYVVFTINKKDEINT